MLARIAEAPKLVAPPRTSDNSTPPATSAPPTAGERFAEVIEQALNRSPAPPPWSPPKPAPPPASCPDSNPASGSPHSVPTPPSARDFSSPTACIPSNRRKTRGLARFRPLLDPRARPDRQLGPPRGRSLRPQPALPSSPGNSYPSEIRPANPRNIPREWSSLRPVPPTPSDPDSPRRRTTRAMQPFPHHRLRVFPVRTAQPTRVEDIPIPP